jgi:uncharacterized protein YggE
LLRVVRPDSFAEAPVTNRPLRQVIEIATLISSVGSTIGAQTSVSRDKPPLDEPVVEVAGHGEAHVAPDRATVIVSVQTKGLAAAQVAAGNARVQRRVLDTLRALGYSGAQVSTISYNVEPNFEPVPNAREPRQRGYIARNAVRVKLTQLDRIGTVIDAALARGANGVEDVVFEASNTDVPRQAALANAVAQARADATVLAKGMGGALGRLVALTTQDQLVYAASAGYAHRRFQLADETPITPTDVTVERSVIARWQFVPTP